MSLLKPNRSAKIGIAMAALAMLALLAVVSGVVIRWCPRGEDCRQTSQILFGIGVLVSFVASVAIGLIARDIADRYAARHSR
ncbi:hypothetical protein [Sphingomonas sp.]|uniref:hypothetical protein n=1 Tax=Sphingomonas sp. TaxID=28214 RepID=UPI0025E5D1C7|nr:hypothetical protein [Sphingomonas sp.]